MNKILLVEDNSEKTQIIAGIVETKTQNWSLHIVGDVMRAKAALKSERYDILLLDINLPKRASEPPSADGGLEILRWLKAKGTSHRPNYVIGLTAHSLSFDLAKSEFDNLIWRVVETSLSAEAWRGGLSKTLDDIAAQSRPPFPGDGVSHHVDLLVVTALETPELKAILELPDTGFEKIEVAHDASTYYRGHFVADRRKLSVIAVAASDKGLAGTAIAATKGIVAFWPKYILMAGISAGVKGRTKIGDVIFADLTWDWGSGKLKRYKGEEVFHPAPYQRRMDETLLNAAKSFKKETAVTENWWNNFEGDKPENRPSILTGAMASGASVLQSSNAVKTVIKQHKDVLGIEMEAFSLMFAAQTSPLPRPLAIVAKSVCDNGDGKKNDKYQAYAAYTSAMAVREYSLRYLGLPED